MSAEWAFGPWPAGLPVQVHGMDHDPFFAEEGDLDGARELVATVGPDVAELYTYPGDKHLFTDSSLPSYDAARPAGAPPLRGVPRPARGHLEISRTCTRRPVAGLGSGSGLVDGPVDRAPMGEEGRGSGVVVWKQTIGVSLTTRGRRSRADAASIRERAGPADLRSIDRCADQELAIWIRLPQVSSRTAVVTGPICGRLLGECDPERAQPLVLRVHVGDGEGGERDAVGDQRLLVRPDGGVLVGLQHELDAVRVLRRHDGEPAVLAQRDVVLLHEAEHVGVERAAPSSWSSTRTLVRLILMVGLLSGSRSATARRWSAAVWCRGRGTCSGPPGGSAPARPPRGRPGAGRRPAGASRARAGWPAGAHSSNSVWPSRSRSSSRIARRVGSASALNTSPTAAR